MTLSRPKTEQLSNQRTAKAHERALQIDGALNVTMISDPHAIRQAKWMALRSFIQLHITVPAFNRARVLGHCRANGFRGTTLKQARVWVDAQCDAVGLDRLQGLPKPKRVED